jgi:hypothetical protein
MAAKTYTGFLPPKKLNFSAEEKRAAVTVLKMMESGQILDQDDEPPKVGTGLRFNMGEILEKLYDYAAFRRPKPCGSVGCLCGWMAHVMGKSPSQAGGLFDNMYKRSQELHDLTMAVDPRAARSWRNAARVKHGARALRSYLTTGKANWRKAMGNDA